MNNYFKSGRYNRKLEQTYSYDKRKKELLDEQRKKEDNNKERCEEEKTATEL